MGEHSESRSRTFLTPRLSSSDDCFSSQMDSPESGDTDDVSSENDSLRTYTQKQNVRPKQLPFPASLLEGKSDDVIVSDINVSGKLSFSFQFRNYFEMILFCNSRLTVVFFQNFRVDV